MSSEGFSKIPTELILLTMTHMETPRDLFAFIRTSSRMHQAFREHRDGILAAVIENAIPPENISTAIAACAAFEVSKRFWANPCPMNVIESQAKFYAAYPWRCAPTTRSLRDRTLQRSLCKLWWISEYFLSCFARDALGLVAETMPLQQKQWACPLTRSEKSRLQRALFHFELYRRLNPATLDKSLGGSNAVYEETFDFVLRLLPWEGEEVLSIQEYLVEFVKRMCRELQDYIVGEISTMTQDLITRSGLLAGSFEREPMKRIKMGLDLSRLDVFQHDTFITERRFQYFVARGLPFIRWMSDLPPKDRIEALVHHSLGECSPSYFEALSSLHDEMHANQFTAFDAGTACQDESYTNTVKGPNEGWKWVTRYDLINSEDSLRKRYTLRRVGYVFWDALRLNEGWKLQLTAPSMLELTPRSWEDDDRDWQNEPGIAERFKDIPIPKGTFSDHKESPLPRLRASDAFIEKVEDGYPVPFSDEEAELFDIEY